MRDGILPLSNMAQLVKKVSPDFRVGKDAMGALREILEDYGTKIVTQAIKLAMHAGRKTLKGGDLKLSVRQ